MGFCCRKQGGAEVRREVVMRFKREELLFDINNYAWIEGDKMGDDTGCRKHLTIDVGQEGNIERVNRILGVVFDEVVDLLEPYVKVPECAVSVLDNEACAPEVYEVSLVVPSRIKDSRLRFLSKLIHEYMVYRVLCDWFSMSGSESVVAWGERAQSAASAIEEATRGTGVFTRPTSVF